ncbi:MAG: hypothetical protein IPJ74_14650 [Saprospiraceae bacterium]|nr:hypothetical protein [Saprospiraceae bacterium]
MGVQELKLEINNILQQFDKKELEIILNLLKQMKSKPQQAIELIGNLQKIIAEDSNLLKRLAE